MDLQKAKIFLEKINREFARMARDPENVARIDVDIICAYTREMYDAFLSEKNTTIAIAAEPPVRQPQQPPVDFSPERPAARTAPAPRREVVATPPPAPEPVYIAPPPPPAPKPAPEPVYVAPPPPPEPIYVAPPPPPPPAPKPAPEPVYVAPPPPEPVFVQPPVVTHRGHHHSDSDSLFEEKKAKELSERLAQSRIADLTRGAISLNDRPLFANLLFGGNGPLLVETLAALNSLSNFAEAKNYLLQNCVERFHWTDKSRQETAKSFIQLVRRRFN